MAELTNNPVSLYVSANDVTLPKLFMDIPLREIWMTGLLLEGSETIDASGIDTNFLGHSYFDASHSLIRVIFKLLKTGRRVALASL